METAAAKSAAALNHPNLVQVHDFGQADGLLYLVMEFIEGEDFSSHVATHGKLPIPTALAVIEQAARALTARAALERTQCAQHARVSRPHRRRHGERFGQCARMQPARAAEHEAQDATIKRLQAENRALRITRADFRLLVKEAMGGTMAKLSVSALLFDYILTGPISSVSAGLYIVGLASDLLSRAGIAVTLPKDQVAAALADDAPPPPGHDWHGNHDGMGPPNGPPEYTRFCGSGFQ